MSTRQRALLIIAFVSIILLGAILAHSQPAHPINPHTGIAWPPGCQVYRADTNTCVAGIGGGYPSTGGVLNGAMSFDTPAHAASTLGALLPGVSADGANGVGVAGAINGPLVNGVQNPGLGLDNTGVTDVHAAIQAALNAGATDFYFPPGTYNIGTVGITIPSSVQRFVMSPGATFLYSGTGTAAQINGTGTASAAPIQPEIRIQVKRTSIGWTGGGDTTSTGISCVNCYHVELRASAQNFHVGMECFGNADGCAENQFFLGNFQDNMISYQHRIVSSGWTNQNKIFGGEFRINSSNCSGGLPVAGTKYIMLPSGSDNMNVFYSPDLEGNCVERTVDMSGAVNSIYEPRLESNVANSLYFSSASSFNKLFNPYLNTGMYTEVLSDNGTYNEFQGAGWWQDAGSFGNNWIQISDSTTVLSGTYVSGGTITGTIGQTCVVTPDPQGSPAATATVALTGTNTIASGTALVITNPGSQYLTPDTSATLSNGTATCSGTAVITTVTGKSNVMTFNPHSRTLTIGTTGAGNVVANQFLLNSGAQLVSKDGSGNVTIAGSFNYGKNLFGAVGAGTIFRLFDNNLTDQNRVDIQVASGTPATGGGTQVIGTYASGGSGDVNIYNETTATPAMKTHLGNAGFGLTGNNLPSAPFCVGNGCPTRATADGSFTAVVLSNGVTTATNSDNRGRLVLVAGTASYTFTQGPVAGSWTTAPVCQVQDQTFVNQPSTTLSVSASTLTIGNGTGLTDTYTYHCWPGN